MKKLKELSLKELRELYEKNQGFASAVYEDAYSTNMDMQADEFNSMRAKVFDYHDHYSSFYLTTPRRYGVKSGYAVAHELNADNMSDKARRLYDQLNALADEMENLESDELDERQDELEDKMTAVCDNLAEQLTTDFRSYENVCDGDIDSALELIADGVHFMSEWETDGTKVYEHITKEYK